MNLTANKFSEYLARKGLHSTKQRDLIANFFFQLKDSHVSAEDLYFKIIKKHPTVGRVTVYRTLKLLKEAGLASEYHFGENHYHYEPAGEVEHHDHLICTKCGSITEFRSPKIEKMQEELANEHEFQINSHKMELYGLCGNCR